MSSEIPISHFLMAHAPEGAVQYVVTESHDGYWAMSDAMIAKTIRFAAEHSLLGRNGFQCLANESPEQIEGERPDLVRLDFCRSPTTQPTASLRFQSLVRGWRHRFLCVEATGLTPDILALARDYDAVFMAPTLDELFGVVRLFLGPGNAIGFDLADIHALVVGRAVEVRHVPIAELPALLSVADPGSGMIIGFSRRLTLTDVDGIVSGLPNRPEATTLFHNTVCGVATMSAEVFVCRPVETP